MAIGDREKWLDAGIAAARAGDGETARAMLSKVVEVDERNEQAWLWLGAVAETEEERRICLENVLALNPESGVAKRGLERLNQSTSSSPTISHRGHHDDSAKQWGLNAQAEEEFRVAKSDEPHEAFAAKDVWDTYEDICAYCAAIVGENERRCPSCRRSLVKKHFRYPATAGLHVFWVFLFTEALILGFQALFKYRFELRNTDAILHAALAGILVIVVIGVNLRLFMAHILSIFVLIMVMILGIYDFLVPFNPASLGMEAADVAMRGFTTEFMNRLGLLLETVQVVLGGVGFFYAALRVAPEFDRVEERNIARTRTGLKTAVDYHMVARRLRQEGKWASAVLHWQRATAIEPARASYQRDLARAYIHLGFFTRAMNVLESARKLPMQPSLRSDVDQLYKWVYRRVSAKGNEGHNGNLGNNVE